MPNPTAGLFQTLVAATSAASSHLRFRNAFVDAIFWDYQPIAASPYTTLNVTIPSVSEGDVVDAQGGPYQPTDTAHSSVPITLDKDFTSSFIIRNWDEVRTPENLREKYIQPRLEGMLRKVNRTLAQLVTTGNFNTHTLISGAGADVFARADLTGAWRNLASVGVPVEDSGNLSFVTNPTAYANMLADSNFVQESIVGVNAAQVAQQRAMLLTQYGANVMYDQHITAFNSGKQPGILMHRFAVAGVTVDPQSNAEFRRILFVRPNLPVLVEMGYSLENRGWLIGMTCQWGLKVVRPEFGSLVETA
jgi:hypothetical protein